MNKFLKFIFFAILIILVFILLLVITLLSVFNYMKTSSESKLFYERGIEIIPNADYIVVPGAGININMPGSILAQRLNYANMLYQANKASKIIVSGGFSKENISYETTVMYTYLVELGVSKENILIDLKGDNTYATLKRVKDYVGEKSIIFCTQELYGYRASYIAKNLGLNMCVFCSDPYTFYNNNGSNILRECFAQFKAVLNCTVFKPDVCSLNTIPIFSEKEI